MGVKNIEMVFFSVGDIMDLGLRVGLWMVLIGDKTETSEDNLYNDNSFETIGPSDNWSK